MNYTVDFCFNAQINHYYTKTLHSRSGIWDWIKNFLSFVPKDDSKIVQLDLLGVAVVLFSFISYLQVCFLISLRFHRPIGQHAYRLFSLAWVFCLSPVPSGLKCVSARSDRLNKQTNKQTNRPVRRIECLCMLYCFMLVILFRPYTFDNMVLVRKDVTKNTQNDFACQINTLK